ncbi:hypothetical protein Glove_440g3 [Diversispora epigaea]|uniref:Uncharacterized protein n=1 Tax=Diversispora epigaea TaxID=1348612 RepID=A0A397GRE8_9GLOM|nr:hypothetical protein Glove_440g2 [Diversispora epigaea]RHZ53632.1 hypothetical protein Glove_440g3 [Diversispora epigaea]
MSISHPLVWSLSANFSMQNSDTIWSYGSKPGYLPNGEFSRMTNLLWDTKDSGVVALFKEDNTWNKDWLGIYYNTKETATLLVYNSNMTFIAHGVCMHPGNIAKEFAVARFTAPVNGTYTIKVKFLHVDDYVKESNTTTGAYVIHNNETIWEEIIRDYIPGSFITNSDGIRINENDTIDFLLGIGVGGAYHMTSVDVDISAWQETTSTTTTQTASLSSLPKPSSENSVNNNNNRKIYLIGGSIGLMLGLIIGGCLAFIYFQYRKKNKRLLIPGSND